MHGSDITNMKSTQAQTATAADAINNLLSHSFTHYFTRTHKYATSHNVFNLGSNLCLIIVSQHDNFSIISGQAGEKEMSSEWTKMMLK